MLLTNAGWLYNHIDKNLAYSDLRQGMDDAQRALCILAKVEPVSLSADDLRRLAREEGISDEHTFEEDGRVVVDTGILFGHLRGERVVRFELPNEITCRASP